MMQPMRRGVSSGVVICFAVWLASVETSAFGQTPQVTPPSLDDALFGDLDGTSMDSDVERELFGDDPVKTERTEPESKEPLSQRRIHAWNDLLEQELAEAAVDEAQNPLLGIARTMRMVEGLIDGNDSGERTQRFQGEIIADIDSLLKRAKKKCQSCASQCQKVAQRKPTQPPKKSKPKKGSPKPKAATTSNVKAGKGEGQMPDMAEMMAVIKQVWGELPEKERQEMLQTSVEEFLPKYADMIERYFKRLAEDRKEPQ